MRRINEERYRQLRLAGRIEIPQSPWYTLFSSIGALVFVAIGAVMIYASIVRTSHWTGALTTPVSWIGLVSILFFGVLGIPAIILGVYRRTTLVLTRNGIEWHQSKKSQRVRVMAIDWKDIEDISGQYIGGSWPSKGQCTVFLRLTPERYAQMLSELNTYTRRFGKVHSTMFGERTISLPRFSGGAKAMHELMERIHREQVSESYFHRSTGSSGLS